MNFRRTAAAPTNSCFWSNAAALELRRRGARRRSIELADGATGTGSSRCRGATACRAWSGIAFAISTSRCRPEPRRAWRRDAAAVAETQSPRRAFYRGRLLEALRAPAVPLLFIKGLTLSKLAYGDPFLKMGWDIDVLVPADAVEAAAEQLQRLGFRLVVPSCRPRLVSKWHRRRKESVWRSPKACMSSCTPGSPTACDLIPSIGARIRAAAGRRSRPGSSLPTLAL